jgi:hypothetical protein
MRPTQVIALLKFCGLYIESKAMMAGVAPGHLILESINRGPLTVVWRAGGPNLAEAAVA